MSSFFQFFKASLKNPLQLSTAFETGPRVGRRFAAHINLQPGQVLAELGVGSGAITVHLLPRLGSPPAYLGFELNKDLHKYLKRRLPFLEVHNESAENLGARLAGRKLGAVVSTLPWSLLPRDVRMQILGEVYNNP
jgi:phospholipid N-methyltransferase